MIRGTAYRHRLQWLLLGIALLTLGALLGYWLHAERGRVESLERNRLQTQARVIDENLSRQLKGMNNALAGFLDEFSLPADKRSAREVSRDLKSLSNAIPGVRTIAIRDARGMAVASSRDELLGSDAGELEYFKIAREGANPGALYIAPPSKTPLGTYSMVVMRVLPGPEGKFGGIVGAALDPEYFDVLLRSVLYAPDMWVSIAHGDGVGFLYMPRNEQAAGNDLAKSGSFFSRHRESGQSATVMTGSAYVTGEERMMAMRTIKPADFSVDKPLVVGVGRDLSAIYAGWRNDALVVGGLYGAMVLTMILGVIFTQRRQMAHDRLEASYETERKRAEDELRQSGTRLRELSQRLIGIEDTVRRNINRELHDRVGANLSALNLNLSILGSQFPLDSLPAAGARLRDTQRLIEETITHVRDLMADLHPPALDDYGLHAALRTYAGSLSARVSVPISMQGEDLVPRPPLAVETALFRVAQGALGNAVTHAHAKRIEILLAESPDRVTLTIADDGAGFDAAQASLAHASWGLAIMRERAEAAGAKLTVESAPGKGTRVCVEIPRERR